MTQFRVQIGNLLFHLKITCYLTIFEFQYFCHVQLFMNMIRRYLLQITNLNWLSKTSKRLIAKILSVFWMNCRPYYLLWNKIDSLTCLFLEYGVDVSAVSLIFLGCTDKGTVVSLGGFSEPSSGVSLDILTIWISFFCGMVNLNLLFCAITWNSLENYVVVTLVLIFTT